MRRHGLRLKERAQRSAKRFVHEILWTALGRRNYARLGRFLWMNSRLDVNDPSKTGELLVQDALAFRLASATRVTVLDVGANVGEWTGSLYERLVRARAATASPGNLLKGVAFHLFEPSPASRATIAVRRNGWNEGATVEVSPLALAEREGESSFSILGETYGINTLRPLPSDTAARSITVQVATLDGYCAAHGIDWIDFLKIDTEGNDCNVLAGAANLLHKKRIGLLQFEYNHRWVAFRHFLKDAFDLLGPDGYWLGKITHKGIEPYAGWHHELETFCEGNYLAWLGPELKLPVERIVWWHENQG